MEADLKAKLIKEAQSKPPSFGFIDPDKLAEISFKAGMQKVVDWENEVCPHFNSTTIHTRDCYKCRQSFLKENGLT